MNLYLLLIILFSWSHVVPLSQQCETGVAMPNHELSIAFSMKANADVALLTTYKAQDVQACMKECCTEKFGSCSVASYEKNANETNCQHFYCRPVLKCKFVSSNSTDSFSFSSSTLPQRIVPSIHASQKHSSISASTAVASEKPKVLNPSTTGEQPVTKEIVVAFSEEQFDLKNDNTTIKPRKGVDNIMMESSPENDTKSGIKPRKGVSFDDVTFSESAKSKVKPRKGVGPYESTFSSLSVVPSTNSGHSSVTSSTGSFKFNADDVVSALEKVFEDDTKEKNVKPTISATQLFSRSDIVSTSVDVTSVVQPSVSIPVLASSDQSHHLQSSFSTNYIISSSVGTPSLQTAFIQSTETVKHIPMPSTSSSNILEHSKLLFHEVSVDEHVESKEISDTQETNESENERKYKSSMHLVLSLVFGLLVLFSVMGVIAKRVYDSWMRRHYRRMDFLIDGMYNGYG